LLLDYLGKEVKGLKTSSFFKEGLRTGRGGVGSYLLDYLSDPFGDQSSKAT